MRSNYARLHRSAQRTAEPRAYDYYRRIYGFTAHRRAQRLRCTVGAQRYATAKPETGYPPKRQDDSLCTVHSRILGEVAVRMLCFALPGVACTPFV